MAKSSGRPRKGAGLAKTFSLRLRPEAAAWLEAQPNMSRAVDELILEHVQPPVDLVVARNPDLLLFFQEIGVASSSAGWINHATREDVEGRVIAGALPLHLAALARAVVQVDFLASPQERGALPLADMRRLWEDGKVKIETFEIHVRKREFG